MPTRRIFALAGLSGVGKTTLIRSVHDQWKAHHFSASDLIKAQIKLEEDAAKSSEDLRAGDVGGNQDRLVLAFQRLAKDVERDIILDCHTLIDTPQGIQEIPGSVFQAIGVTDFIFFSVEPAELCLRRQYDTSRNRPVRSSDELALQQVRALDLARGIADALQIPFHVISDAPAQSLLTIAHSASAGRA